MKKSKKRQQIIKTATELFTQYGARRVTVREICELAEVSKVTFYKHFKNKDDLIRHIRDEFIAVGFAKFDEISAMELPYPQKIDLMTRWRMEFFSKLSAEFIQELFTLDEVVAEAKRRYLKNIADAQAKGEIRPDLTPELIWLVSDRLTGIVRDESWRTVFTDYATFQEQMRKLFFYGLLTRDGDLTIAGD